MHNNLAQAYDEKGDVAAAAEHYEKAIALWDVYPQTHYNYANLLLRAVRIDEAIAQDKRALELDPTFYRAAAVLALIYDNRGDSAAAEPYRQLAEKFAPKQ